MKFFDAHNHLQDNRFAGRQSELLAMCEKAGVARMVVNGSCESDWPQVLQLARQFGGAGSPLPAVGAHGFLPGVASSPEGVARPTEIIPSFGYHPWYLGERSPDWLTNLVKFLDAIPGAVGEIGLDRWKPDLPYAGQEEAFLAQLHLAAERNLPVSIHCLEAWGRLHELLRDHPRPARGLVLHSFGGPAEMIPAFARLGAYFSFPGYFLNDRKQRRRETFRHVPPDRLLIETDAPDQLLPAEKNLHPLVAADGKPLNHPANIAAVYAGLAEFLGEELDSLVSRVEENFQRVFGGI